MLPISGLVLGERHPHADTWVGTGGGEHSEARAAVEGYEAAKREDVSPEEWALHTYKDTRDWAARTANIYSGLARS